MRYPPGTWVPSVMESPRGMTRTPPLDSALATPECSATAAATIPAAAAASHLARVCMERPPLTGIDVRVANRFEKFNESFRGRRWPGQPHAPIPRVRESCTDVRAGHRALGEPAGHDVAKCLAAGRSA